MLDLSQALRFRLFPHRDPRGPSCDHRGAYVAGVPLLKRKVGASSWVARPVDELNAALGAAYDAPLDLDEKIFTIERIAQALNEGDVAKAHIMLLHARFPEIPTLEKSTRDPMARARLLALLWRGGLLKGDWNEADHPRAPAGTREGGRFIPKATPGETDGPKAETNVGPRSGQYTRAVGQAIRRWVAAYVERWGIAAAVPPLEAITAFVSTLDGGALNQGEDKAIAEMYAQWTPTRTLDELYKEPPMPARLGFQQHHIVGQNPTNREKFGDQIDNAENIVWIPTLQHEKISAYYNEKPEEYGGLTRREWETQYDFDTQFQHGLTVMHNLGILK